ncbi:MAG: hypothetical protein A2506_02415 [Elusimicrobia bacterium RIFOXYD12_FULL_66_9]|nr:MAG: hypothetical protein A2506_02415 [Elusimicrobia bacterium RIFOXYD12_FULL_66_9]
MVTTILLATSLAASAAAPAPSLVVRLEASLSESEFARRLLVATESVPRHEVHAAGLPRAVDVRGGGRPEIVLDLVKVEELPAAELTAQYALALARAAVAAPVPLVEAEQAAWQWTAQILVERAAEDPALSAVLARAQLRPEKDAPVLSRAAAYLALFERDPRAFYWAVESGGGFPREAVRLTDLEDLVALRGREIAALERAPQGVYGELGNRRYPVSLVRAAFALRSGGQLVRLREALGAYDTAGIPSLRAALTRWRRR